MLARLTRNSFIIFGSCLLGAAYNTFLLPNKILSGGVTGLGMIVALVANLDAGTVILLLNIPVFALGFFTLGHRFVLRSGLSVLVTSLTMQLLPVRHVTDDSNLAAVFGGALVGIAVGIVLRSGGSTGGFDIIGMVLTRKREFPLGQVMFAMNAVVVCIAGFVFTWERALYTLVSMFVTSRVIDAVHQSHVKLTLLIVTTRGQELRSRLVGEFFRGVTVLQGQGGFTGDQRQVLLNVITRLELDDVKRVIREVDPDAFVNVMATTEIMGRFYRDPDPEPKPAAKHSRRTVPPDDFLAAG